LLGAKWAVARPLGIATAFDSCPSRAALHEEILRLCPRWRHRHRLLRRRAQLVRSLRLPILR
jgi:hypothetical protein